MALQYNKPCVYVIVCKDMRMRDIVVQSCHAALEAGIHLEQCSDYPSALVTLQVSSEDRLLKAKRQIENKGIRCHLFYERPMGRYTALATEAINSEQRKAFKKFQLLSTYRPTFWDKVKGWFKWKRK